MLNEGNMAGVSPEGRFSFIYNILGFKPTSLEIPNETMAEVKKVKSKDKKMRRKLQNNKKVELIMDFLLSLKVLTKSIRTSFL